MMRCFQIIIPNSIWDWPKARTTMATHSCRETSTCMCIHCFCTIHAFDMLIQRCRVCAAACWKSIRWLWPNSWNISSSRSNTLVRVSRMRSKKLVCFIFRSNPLWRNINFFSLWHLTETCDASSPFVSPLNRSFTMFSSKEVPRTPRTAKLLDNWNHDNRNLKVNYQCRPFGVCPFTWDLMNMWFLFRE